LGVEIKGETLRVTVQRMGQARPTRLEICERATPERPQRNAPRVWLINTLWNERSKGNFPT